jgi:putative glycosyltransferase (TIGR04372 family)
VMTYLPAVQKIVDHGGWVIRVGDPSMKPLPEMEHVVDYVHSPLHSEWMDVFLAASCRFCLGTSSGMFVVAWSFGRPSALANWESLALRPWASSHVFIPKLWRLDAEDRLLTFAELTRPPYVDAVRRIRPSEQERLGLSLVDNTAEEIEELVEEMFEREAGGRWSDEQERLQAAFEGIVAEHYPHGAAARIGSRFLARHRDLLSGLSPHEMVRPD